MFLIHIVLARIQNSKISSKVSFKMKKFPMQYIFGTDMKKFVSWIYPGF